MRNWTKVCGYCKEMEKNGKQKTIQDSSYLGERKEGEYDQGGIHWGLQLN